MEYTSKNTEFRNYVNNLIEECKVVINNEQLITEINNYFVQCFENGQLNNEFYSNKFIDNVAVKSKNIFNHTIDSLALWCELQFDILYLLNIIQKFKLDEESLNFMNNLFLNKANAINACNKIEQQNEREELFVVAIFNLMQSYRFSGNIPEYILSAYRYCKRGYSFAETQTSQKVEKKKKADKIFANAATSLYEAILGEGYSKITKTNGFWGRAFSGGKQKASYNVYNVASHFALGARFAQAECKILFPFNPEYFSIFEQIIKPYLDLDKLFSKANLFIDYDMNVESALQKLLNFSWFDSGMLGVRENLLYQKQIQNTNQKVCDMQSMASFVEGALTQANSWGVDGGPKNYIYHTLRKMLK